MLAVSDKSIYLSSFHQHIPISDIYITDDSCSIFRLLIKKPTFPSYYIYQPKYILNDIMHS